MKPTEFIVETSMIAQEADTMHADHEVQMARADCYNAAKYAIELHKLLKNMSESQGLDGWVSEKITLANDYLHMVHEYLKYENVAQPDMMEFAESAADYAVDQLLAEDDDKVDEAAKHGLYYNVNKRKKAGTSRPASSPKAPSAQAWKDAAKTAKKEGVAPGKKIAEMATGGGSSSAGVATSMGGPAHKPTSGVPKKLGNAAKMKKVTVGKGIY